MVILLLVILLLLLLQVLLFLLFLFFLFLILLLLVTTPPPAAPPPLPPPLSFLLLLRLLVLSPCSLRLEVLLILRLYLHAFLLGSIHVVGQLFKVSVLSSAFPHRIVRLRIVTLGQLLVSFLSSAVPHASSASVS
jgi:hypothetical protein